MSIENITKISREYWEAPNGIPDDVKNASQFQPCHVCTYAGQNVLCHAIYPVLPLYQTIKTLKSIDEVLVVYVDKEARFTVQETTTQRALMYLAFISLFDFCEAMSKYKKYFYNVSPINSPKGIAKHIYLNIYYIHQGDQNTIDQTLLEMSKIFLTTTTCQANRLRLLKIEDGLLNSFVNTEAVVQLLLIGKDKFLQKDFAEASIPKNNF